MQYYWLALLVGVFGLMNIGHVMGSTPDNSDDETRSGNDNQPRIYSGHLTRYAENPILANGPAEYDSVKVGPRVVLKEGSMNYRLWYEAVPGGNRSSVGYATSPDGLHWTKQGEVLLPSEAWEGGSNGEVSPNSILVEDGIYKLWYHSYDGRTRRIGLATSPDGLLWTKYAGNPVLDIGSPGTWEDAQIAEPRVVKVGDEYRMYYMGLSSSTGGWRIGFATSHDGIHWEKYAKNPVFGPTPGAWDSSSTQMGGLLFEDDIWHLWYSGYAESSGGAIGYAWSSDGITWTKGVHNPVLTANPEPTAPDAALGDSVSVHRDENTYRVMYAGFNFSDNPMRTICLATILE